MNPWAAQLILLFILLAVKKVVCIICNYLQKPNKAWLRTGVEQSLEPVAKLLRFDLRVDQLLDEVPHVPLDGRRLLARQIQEVRQEVTTLLLRVVGWFLKDLKKQV